LRDHSKESVMPVPSTSPRVSIAVVSSSAKTIRSILGALPDHTRSIDSFRSEAMLRHHLAVTHADLIIVDDEVLGPDGMRFADRAEWRDGPSVLFMNVRSDERCAFLLRQGADEAIVAHSPTFAVRLTKAVQRAKQEAKPECVAIGDLMLDRGKRKIRCRGREVHLTTHEWHLFECLASHSPEPVSVASLAQLAWSCSDSTKALSRVQVYVCYLRQKLAASSRVSVRNVRGVGYQLVIERERSLARGRVSA
jgi:DNA-binding response OmpR family regulator